MLNAIWLGFFLVAFASALWQWLGLGDAEVFSRLVTALFDAVVQADGSILLERKESAR